MITLPIPVRRGDEKMRSDRGEWDRKRTGSGNTDKRKKNRRSRPSGRERRAVKKYRLIRSGVLLLFFLTVVLLLRSCIRKVRGTDSMSSDYGTVNVFPGMIIPFLLLIVMTAQTVKIG